MPSEKHKAALAAAQRRQAIRIQAAAIRAEIRRLEDARPTVEDWAIDGLDEAISEHRGQLRTLEATLLALSGPTPPAVLSHDD